MIHDKIKELVNQDMISKEKVIAAIEKMKDKWCMDIDKIPCEDCDVCKQFNDLKEELGL